MCREAVMLTLLSRQNFLRSLGSPMFLSQNCVAATVKSSDPNVLHLSCRFSDFTSGVLPLNVTDFFFQLHPLFVCLLACLFLKAPSLFKVCLSTLSPDGQNVL